MKYCFPLACIFRFFGSMRFRVGIHGLVCFVTKSYDIIGRNVLVEHLKTTRLALFEC